MVNLHNLKFKSFDWTDPSAYPSVETTSHSHWAWEFLRRNVDYRRDIYEFLKVCDEVIPGSNPLLKCTEDYIDQVDVNPKLRHYHPAIVEGETEEGWLYRLSKSKGKGRSQPLSSWYAKKWGLRDLSWPDTEYKTGTIMFLDTVGAYIAGPGFFNSDDIKFTITATAYKQAFVVDYRRPIKPQLKAIKRYAESHLKFLIKNGHVDEFKMRAQTHLYPNYLRCLDADAAGVSIGEIAKMLCPEKDDNYPDSLASGYIRDQMVAAKSLRDNGYRYLAMK